MRPAFARGGGSSEQSGRRGRADFEGGVEVKFYTIKLPKFLGGIVKMILNTFSKN